MDFGLGKRLTNLPALAQIGYTANRRLLGAQRLSHDPITGADALHATCDPITREDGTRTAGLRLTDPRAQALLHILLIFRLHPGGFLNRDLRDLLAESLGRPPGTITPGQATYDLRRLREHGLIERIPRTHRYQVTDTGLRQAMFLTRVHDRVLQTGSAQLNSPAPTALRQADRAYQAAIRDLTHSAGVTA
jgi:DNA-binding PadR family transcriptional regulator